MKILVSNLNTEASEADVELLFGQHGDVVSARLVRGWDNNESRGLAVVEMSVRAEGEASIRAINRKDYMEQRLAVNEIRAPFFQHETLLERY